jgi:hypothetical protein
MRSIRQEQYVEPSQEGLEAFVIEETSVLAAERASGC